MSSKASSVERLQVESSVAGLDLILSEVASDMLQPLLLPVREDNKRSEYAPFLQVEKLLLCRFSDLRVTPLLSSPFDVRFQDNIGHSKHSVLLLLVLFVHELIQPLLEFGS